MAFFQSKAGQTQPSDELPPKIEAFFSDFLHRVEQLTPMERTVLQYYIDGYKIEETAARAFISVNTAKKHNTNINRKLGVTTREELTGLGVLELVDCQVLEGSYLRLRYQVVS